MSSKVLYRTIIPEDGIATVDDRTEQTVETLGLLDDDAEVKPVSGGAGDYSIQVSYLGTYAEMLSTELRELLESSTIQTMPFHTLAGEGRFEDGYYAAEIADSNRVDERSAFATAVTFDLVREGTRNSHWVAVETNPDQPDPGSPEAFGNDTDALVGIPANAKRVKVVDSASQPTERAIPTPIETVATEFGAVDLYDATTESSNTPVYLYDIDYAEQGKVDVHLWDSYGRSKFGTEGETAWQRVFDRRRDFRGAAVMENGRLRVHLDDEADEPDETLTASRWDSDDEQWSTVSEVDPAAAGWSLFDLDVEQIGMVRVNAQLEFVSDDGELYALDMSLSRGQENAQFWIVEDDPVPNGLVDLLGPITESTVVDAQSVQTLVSRGEVRL